MTQDIIREGPSIQNMPSEQMRFQLINMAVALDKAMNIIGPKELKVNLRPMDVVFGYLAVHVHCSYPQCVLAHDRRCHSNICVNVVSKWA